LVEYLRRDAKGQAVDARYDLMSRRASEDRLRRRDAEGPRPDRSPWAWDGWGGWGYDAPRPSPFYERRGGGPFFYQRY